MLSVLLNRNQEGSNKACKREAMWMCKALGEAMWESSVLECYVHTQWGWTTHMG